VTVEPTIVGCLQVQPVVTVGVHADVQSEVGGEQVPALGDAAPATVDPLGARLFLTVPAQAGLGQGGGVGGGIRAGNRAGAFSLAADRLREHLRRPVPPIHSRITDPMIAVNNVNHQPPEAVST
jgi:hypothetical protein